MAKRSNYQQRVIKNYYQNREAIMLQRLGELVSELYLAEGKARSRLWERAAGSLQHLGVPPQRIGHLLKSDNPGLLASLVKELLDEK